AQANQQGSGDHAANQERARLRRAWALGLHADVPLPSCSPSRIDCSSRMSSLFSPAAALRILTGRAPFAVVRVARFDGWRFDTMAKAKRYIPEGLQAVTPSLVVDGAAQAIDWYKKVFGAAERGKRHLGPGGKVMHAEVQIGSSVLFINDMMQGAPSVVQDGRKLGGSPVGLTLYLEDCDSAFKKASENGAKVTMPIGDQFWGDRWGSFSDR